VRKSLLLGLSAFMISPLVALVGLSNARADAGDDAFVAFMSRNYSRALELAWPAAQEGNFRAQFVLGRIYGEGKSIPADKAGAGMWFKKALVQAKPAAESGDPKAQFILGRMYDGGWILPKDKTQAAAWYRKAAEQGDAFAQSHLGLKYASGEGVPQNYNEAVVWLRKSAEQGNDLAEYSLAVMYEEGHSVRRDDSEALRWYQKAADQDYVPSSRENKPGDLWAEAFATKYERKRSGSPAAVATVSKDDVQAMVHAAVQDAVRTQDSSPKAINSDVDTPKFQTPEEPDNFAVVIGVEKYGSLPSAQFADRDAEAVRANLLALGYPMRNIFFLNGQLATRAKMAQSVNTWLPNRVSEKSTVFFYYAGHGAPDPKTNQTYLVPVDGDGEDLESTSYPLKTLYAKLGNLKARKVLVALDSCFSGAGGRSVLAKGTRPLISTIDMGIVPENLIVLTASNRNQISGTIDEQGHGAFTYYMLKGLEGAAKTNSGHVTVQSLYDYLTPKVEDAARLHNRDQTPQLLPEDSERTGARLR
jgi:TPR repeat protein